MNPREIKIEDYNYNLPDERIAKRPLEKRDSCKLLLWNGGKSFSETLFNELPGLLPPDSVLVYNNTRVINARIRFRKETGALIEVFCLEPVDPSDYACSFASTRECSWLCFVGNSKKWKNGELCLNLEINGKEVKLYAKKNEAKGNAWVVGFRWTGDLNFSEIISAAGEIPVPPYLNRPTEEADSVDYQTVYGRIEGSVAAPTAGLHFTPEVLDDISKRLIPRYEVTLHVGAGTFQPVKSDKIGEHPMHSEFIAVSRKTIDSLKTALENRFPVIAVGTTTVRTLESLYYAGCLIYSGKWNGEIEQWYPYDDTCPDISPKEAFKVLSNYLSNGQIDTFIANTRIIIAPGYRYKVVDGIITNFHQPKSTLLLLVSAFIGDENWRRMYEYALENDFRFLSYGDACLLLPQAH